LENPVSLPVVARAPGLPLTLDLLTALRARLAVRWQSAAVTALTVLAFALFAWASIAEHRAFHSHAYDLSWFDQSAWNTAHGHWLGNSFSHGSYLKEHFSPIILLLGLVYRVFSTPEALLVIQAMFAALPAIPLYLVARNALQSASAGLMVAASYLVSPQLHGYILFDFHPDVIAVVFVFACFYLLDRGKPGIALLVLAPAFLVKEDVGLIGIGLAVLFWLYGQRSYARRLFAASALFIVVAEFVILVAPLLFGMGHSGEQTRYAYLVHGGLHDPILLWNHLTGPLQIQALAYVLGSQGLLPLAGPGLLIAPVDLLPHLLADHKPQMQLTLQYPIYPLTLLMIASVVNVKLIAGWRPALRIAAKLRLRERGIPLVLTGLLLAAETSSWLIGSPLGLHIDLQRFRQTEHTAAIERVIAQLPPDASLSAQSSILPHLSERTHIREFPFLDYAAYVLIDRKGFRAWQSDVMGYDHVLADLPNRGYCLVKAEDGVELYALDRLCEGR
jgi:uncharacterized membrane protein